MINRIDVERDTASKRDRCAEVGSKAGGGRARQLAERETAQHVAILLAHPPGAV
jgi:hypothetical protein